MPFKITLIFEQPTGPGGGGTGTETRVAGWTESLWTAASTPAGFLPQLYDAGAWGLGLCNSRALCLPAEGEIVGQRYAPFDVNLNRIGKAQTANRVFPGQSYATDLPNMALNCSSPSGNSSNVRHFRIQDIPDNQITFGEYTPNFDYNFNIVNYLNELAAWEFLGQDLTVPIYPVSQVDTAGNWTTIPAHGFLVGDKIQYRRILSNLGQKLYSGTAIVTAIGPAANQFKTAWPLGLAGSGGTVRKYVPKLFPMLPTPSATWSRVVSRKVGRPSAGFRGRRSKRKAS